MSSEPTIRRTRDGSLTVYSPTYDQTYHSIHGALTEARHVFLRGTGILDRLANGNPTFLLEVGLGTGMNFLLTATEALYANTPLNYWAFEQHPMPLALFKQLQFDSFITQTGLLVAFSQWLTTLEEDQSRGTFTFEFQDILSLTVITGDATTASIPSSLFHVVYLDAFSPNVNPELWTPAFLSGIFTAMEPGGCLSTYSARRLVRDNLAAAGFLVRKKQGPPGKREMVIALKPDHEQPHPKKHKNG